MFQHRIMAAIIDSGDLDIPKTEASAGSLQSILSSVFLLAGGIAVIFVIVGGLKYVLSAGDPSQTAKAKDTILYAVIGLVVSLLAFVIVRLVTGRLTGIT